jgi:hypothetical protein
LLALLAINEKLVPMDEIDEIFRIDPAWKLRQSLSPHSGAWAHCNGNVGPLATIHLTGHLSKLLSFVLEPFTKLYIDTSAQTDNDTLFLSSTLGK